MCSLPSRSLARSGLCLRYSRVQPDISRSLVCAGLHPSGRCGLGVEHELVDLALAGSELAVGWIGAGDVGRVAVVLSADVDHDEVAVLDLAAIGEVVRNRRIRARADDRREPRALGSPADERGHDLGFELILEEAGLDRLDHLVLGRRR